MKKRRFTPSERHAIYTVHGERCYIGHEAISLREMQVDHVIPESLKGKPAELAGVLADFGLPADFDLNSYGNWLPACGPCNRDKQARVFRVTPLIQQQLDTARARAPQVRALVETIVSHRQIDMALSALERAIDSGQGVERFRDELRRLVQMTVPYREHVLQGTPFRLSPVVVYEDEHLRIVSGPYGVGGGPNTPSSANRCGVCGSSAWNGARCVVCGSMDDGD